MNPISFCLLLAWAADPTMDPAPQVYNFSSRLEAAIRGQSPDPIMVPGGTGGPVLGNPVPLASEPYNPFAPEAMQDPVLGGGLPMYGGNAYGPNPYGGPIYSGVVGPQPYRYGLIPKLDFTYIPESNMRDAFSGVEMFAFDSELRHNLPLGTGWLFSYAPQFNYRAWDYEGLAHLFLDDQDYYRFGLDMQMVTPEVNGWSLDFGFNPAVGTDMRHQLTSEAWMFDGRIAARWRIDPVWTAILGVQYYDRVDDVIIPYGGIVFTPNDLWEFRLTFPRARISKFVGNFWGGSHWMYLGLDYHVEAYQVAVDFSSPRNQVQYEDWRLSLGLRSDHDWFEKYIEVAWVFDRNIEFKQDLPKIDVGESVLVRAGIRF